MANNHAIEELILQWEKRIELNETQRCSMAEYARRKLASTVYRVVIDELREAIRSNPEALLR